MADQVVITVFSAAGEPKGSIQIKLDRTLKAFDVICLLEIYAQTFDRSADPGRENIPVKALNPGQGPIEILVESLTGESVK